jgi:hypothetical protein
MTEEVITMKVKTYAATTSGKLARAFDPAGDPRTTLRRTIVLVALALLTASTAHAQPYYAEKGFHCVPDPYGRGGGSITVKWPSLTSTTANIENVYFSAYLYKYNTTTRQWDAVGMRPSTMTLDKTSWYWGRSNLSGPMNIGTISYPGTFALGATIQAEPFFAVGPGQYAVLEYYQWTYTPGTYSAWATLQSNYSVAFYKNTGVYSCTL